MASTAKAARLNNECLFMIQALCPGSVRNFPLKNVIEHCCTLIVRTPAHAECAAWAIRTPISLVRCSTRYESTLNSPDSVRRSASAPSTSVSQNGIARRYASMPAMVRSVVT